MPVDIRTCLREKPAILMEGALGERLKREYRLSFDPQIAMASLVESEEGRRALRGLWLQYAGIARRYELPFLAATPTRRANRERMALAGREGELLEKNVRFLREIQRESGIEMYVGGLMGCRGDAYTGQGALNERESLEFHRWQAERLRDGGADFLFAGIMPNLPEAVGMAGAMSGTGLPYIISFTIRRDGRLIDGTAIHTAIDRIDESMVCPPLCYMTNCVHPSIAYEALNQPFNRTALVRKRFLGIQANTSPLDYSELDGAEELFCSEPGGLARGMQRLRRDMGLKIMGGCCGTDARHMEAVARLLGSPGGGGDEETENQAASHPALGK